MNPLQLPTTYRELIWWCFPNAATDVSTSASTAPYSCDVRPADGTTLELSTPAIGDPLWSRAINALATHLGAQRLDAILNNDIKVLISLAATKCPDEPYVSKETVLLRLVDLHNIVNACIRDLSPDHFCRMTPTASEFSQRGDEVHETFLRGVQTRRIGWVVERKTPKVLLGHAARLYKCRRYSVRRYAGGPRSMLFKIYLQMTQGNRDCALFYSGNQVIFVEKEVSLSTGERALRISPVYECFHHAVGAQATGRAVIPILGVLLALSMPDLVIPLGNGGEVVVPPDVVAPPPIDEVFHYESGSSDEASDTGNDPSSSSSHASDLTYKSASDNSSSDATDSSSNICTRLSVAPLKCFVLKAGTVPDTTNSFAESMSTPSLTSSISTLLSSSSSSLSSSSWVTRSTEYSSSGAPILWASKFLHQGPNARTWLVHSPNGHTYVAKVFDAKDKMFDREAKAVETVRMRCGDVAPCLLGRYRGKHAVALLQEHGGSTLDCRFDKLSGEDRTKLWSLITMLHSRGIEHGDLEPRNIVRGSDGKLRVLDLGGAHLSHKCLGPDCCEELSDLKRLLFTI